MKAIKKVVTLALAAIMIVGAMQTVCAAGSTHVLESKTLTAIPDKGTCTDGQAIVADDYFTLYMSANSRIDSSSKEFADGYKSEQRINFGGKADVSIPKNAVAFKTSGEATVKIWWVEGGDDHRELAIFKADGTVVAKTAEGAAAEKNGLVMSTLTIAEAGSYFLGGDTNNNYIFKIEVTEGGLDNVPGTGVVSMTVAMGAVALVSAGVAFATRKKED